MEIRHISSAERKRLQNNYFMSLKVIFQIKGNKTFLDLKKN